MSLHSVVEPEHELTEAELEAREAVRLSKIDNMKKAPTQKHLKELLNPDLKSIRKKPDGASLHFHEFLALVPPHFLPCRFPAQRQ